MKFYFCEKCGKRLTENDIDGGQARDKKLKGVFCSDCAVGVMTMETMPLDEDQARSILEQEKMPASGPTPAQAAASIRPAKHQTTGSMPVAKRMPRPVTGSSGTRAPLRATHETGARGARKKTSSPAAMGVVASGVGILVLLIVALVSMGGSPAPKPPSQEIAEAPGTSPIPPITEQRAIPRALPAVTTSPEPDQSDEPEVEPTATTLEPAQPDTATDAAPAPMAAPPVEDETQAAGDTAPADQTSKPSQPDQPSQPAPPAEAPRTAGLQAAVETLPKFCVLLAQGSEAYPQVETLLKETPSLEPELAALMSAAIESKRGERLALQETMKSLVGKKVDLDTLHGKAAGTVEKADETGLWIKRSFTINGQVRDGGTVMVKLMDLTPEARADLAPAPEPADAAQWLVRALRCAADDDWKGARSAARRGAGHAQATAVEAFISKKLEEAREVEARRKFEELTEQGKASLNHTQAKALQDEIDLYLYEYESTEFLNDAGRQKTLSALMDTLKNTALGMDPLVKTLFKGRIVDYDAATQRITLFYDFSDEEQLQDFYAKPARSNYSHLTLIKGQGIKMHSGGTANQWLRCPQFHGSDVKVDMEITVHHTLAGAENKKVIAFFTENSKEAEFKALILNGDGAHVVQVGAKRMPNATDQVARARGGHASEIFPDNKWTKLTFGCEGTRYYAEWNGKTAIEHVDARPNMARGFGFGSGWDTGYTIRAMQVRARLHPDWLQPALAEARKRAKALKAGASDPSTLIRGQVHTFDKQTGKITVSYDFSNATHRADVQPAPQEGKYESGTGSYAYKGGIFLNCKDSLNRLVMLNQYLSGDITLKFAYSDFRFSWGTYRLLIGFHGPPSDGKSTRVDVVWEKDGWHFKNGTQDLAVAPYKDPPPVAGVIEVSCKGNAYQVKLNDKVVAQYAAPQANDHRGISIGGGLDTFYLVKNIRIDGQLDGRWLAALKKQ